MKTKCGPRGSASIIVLLLCMVLTGVVQALYYSLREEADAANEVVVRRQLQMAAADALACTLQAEAGGVLPKSLVLPEQQLYPAQALLQTTIVVEENEELPGRKISVTAATPTQQIQLTEVCLQPPLGRQQKFYQNTLTAGKDIAGTVTGAAAAISADAGTVLKTLDVSRYKKWSRYKFLTNDEYQQLGLGQRIYYNDDLYGAVLPSLVRELKGEAFLLAEKNITIENNLHLLGRVTLVVGDNLVIGDNVRLDQALLVVKNNLRIGSDCSIKGIIVAGGTVTLGNNFTLQRDERVLAPYFAAVDLE